MSQGRRAQLYLHNNQSEREHQQDGEFVEYECREHVKTCSIVAETHIQKEEKSKLNVTMNLLSATYRYIVSDQ